MMSEKNEDLLASLKAAQTQEELVWEITRLNMAKLSPVVQDAAYRCAILHWFNPEVLQAVLGPERMKQVVAPDVSVQEEQADLVDVEAIYKQLRQLSFIEVYSEYGYSFHTLTRDVILDNLWQHEREFYRAVSRRAAEYFGRNLDTEEGISWEEVIEWVYHFLIADEETAVELVNDLVTEAAYNAPGSYCDALVQTIDEHARGNRLSHQTQVLLQYWKILAASANGRHDEVKTLAADLLAAENEYVSPLLKVWVRFYLADSLRVTSEYTRATAEYSHILQALDEIGDIRTLRFESLKGLARAAISQGRLDDAEKQYKAALITLIRQQIRIPYEDEEGQIQIDRDGISQEEILPEEKLVNPGRWYGWHDVVDSEDEDSSNSLFYLIDIKDTYDTSEDSSEKKYFIVEINSECADLWLNLSYIYYDLGKYDLSSATARLAGRMFTDLDSPTGIQRALQHLFNLGVTTLDQETINMSAEYQHKLLEIVTEQDNPGAKLQALLGLAGIYWNQSDYIKAREMCLSALELARELEDQSSIAVALDNLANLELILGDLKAARQFVLEAIALYRELKYHEGEARLLITFGRIAQSERQLTEAATQYQKALDIFTNYHIPEGQIDAYRGLANIAWLDEQDEVARDYFLQALKLARHLRMPAKEISLLLALARWHQAQQEFEQARKLFSEARSIARATGQTASEADVLSDLGTLAVDQKEFIEAEALFNAAEAIYSQLNQKAGQLEVLFKRIDLLQTQGKQSEAFQIIEEALDVAEELGDREQIVRALMLRYHALKRRGQFDQLLEILDKVLSLNANKPDVLANKGDILCELAEYEAAVEAFAAVNELDPQNSWAYQMKGWALENLGEGRAEECLQAYETAVSIAPNNYWAHKGVAEAYRMLGQEKQAQNKFRWIADHLQTAELEADEASLLAWCYYRLQEYDKAATLYIQLTKENKYLLFNLFDYPLTLLCMGKTKEALETYQYALEQIEQRPPLARRGLLYVAFRDLQEAIQTRPGLAKNPDAQAALQALQQAWQAISQ
ncbi:MAG: tetratricopeptide repeat protein [Chloroflexi bacterium]|nr:MAG: tetratricopeptide repeat protein [Chloroflexota bacterium]